MQQMLLLILSVCLSLLTTAAGLLQPPAQIVSTVHNAPSAVSHQSFTRIHNQPRAQDTPYLDLDTPIMRRTVLATHAAPVIYGNGERLSSAVIRSDTPIVQTLTHTPAHLTYAAAPVVFQTLPYLPTTHEIAYDSTLLAENSIEYRH